VIINYEEKNLLIRYVSVKPCEISIELIYMSSFTCKYSMKNLDFTIRGFNLFFSWLLVGFLLWLGKPN
jgi:hypothetical protein